MSLTITTILLIIVKFCHTLQVVSAQLETSKCKGELQETQTGLGEALKEVDEVKEERIEVEKEYEQKLTSMQRTYEDKVRHYPVLAKFIPRYPSQRTISPEY